LLVQQKKKTKTFVSQNKTQTNVGINNNNNNKRQHIIDGVNSIFIDRLQSKQQAKKNKQ
jgi:hypothetical protein